MIAVGKDKAVLVHGDRHPAELYVGDRKIAGFTEQAVTGTGRVEIGESPYNAALPSVHISGIGRQMRLGGRNLFDLNWLTKKPQIGLTKTGFKIVDSYGTNIVSGTNFCDLVDTIRGKTITISCKFSMPVPPTASNGSMTIISANTKLHPSISILSYLGRTTTVQIPEDIDANNYYGLYAYGIDGHEVIFDNFQIELGSTPTPYEPYCGGIPAPNPQYPIEPVFLEGASITDGANTAPLPILRALPDGSVRDEIDLRTGTVTRHVGVKELTRDMLWGIQKLGTHPEWLGVWNDFTPDWQWKKSKELQFCGYFTHGHIGQSGVGTSAKVNAVSPNDRFTSLLLDFDKSVVGEDLDAFLNYMDNEKAKGTPMTLWFPLEAPIIEHYDPAILRQHPGYTQLIQQGGELTGEITATYYKEVQS